MLASEDEKVSGEEIVRIIETTPLDDEEEDVSSVASGEGEGSDFLPIVREVLGKVQGVVLEGYEAAELEERLRQEGQASEASPPPPTTSSGKEEGGAISPLADTLVPELTLTPLSCTSASTSFSSLGGGKAGRVSFTRPRAPGQLVSRMASSASSRWGGAGKGGGIKFRRIEVTLPSPSPSPSPSPLVASQPPPPPPPLPPVVPPVPEIKIDKETLTAISRAIMGRLDIVDLVGKNTAYEAAERVRDALLDPEVRDRLVGVRRYVEGGAEAPFPPEPTQSEISGPMLGQLSGSLEYWKRRHFRTVSWSGAEMLFSERQMKWFRQDMDLPKDEDTSQGKKSKKEAEEKEAAAKS
jgi:hypothetical protein